jgi:acyl-coenzyme A synthetase/AMP-(fatty) acid ligase
MLALARMLEGGRPMDHPVAVGKDRIYTYGDFLRTAAAISAHARGRGPGRWLLAREDAWGFLTGLFGLLAAGCSVAIPPNHLPATLDRLRPGMDGVLDVVDGLPAGPPFPPGPIPDGGIEFWTSGSTGEPKRVAKRLSQMNAEVQMLETAFGDRFAGGMVLGTVPPHHIYGCLFLILWPLASGRPLALEPWSGQARTHAGPGDGPAHALVSSPALLSRLPRMVDLDRLAPIAAVAFSSGGPLSREDALAWRRWVPGGVAEIYGSTETGGIAWRVQSEAADSIEWTPFPDVAIAYETDGALRVASPRVGPLPLRMEDAAEATASGRFRLKGRLDRIVKLEEKRIALPELEAALGAHPWVQRAALVLLEGPRAVLGAAVVLTLEGREQGRTSRQQLVRGLQRHLAQRFDGLAVPKRWRFLDGLPFDDRGKLLPQTLAGLFTAEEPCPDPQGR